MGKKRSMMVGCSLAGEGFFFFRGSLSRKM